MKMKRVFALQPLPKSIFLAGPTPREEHVPTWRPKALYLLEHTFKFNGTVYIPETHDWSKHDHYDNQIEWEWEALEQATVVVFWVPRDLALMPAFTTNVEFGLRANSSRVILGYPKNAPKNRYLHALAQRYGIPVYHTLHQTLKAAVNRTVKPFSVDVNLNASGLGKTSYRKKKPAAPKRIR